MTHLLAAAANEPSLLVSFMPMILIFFVFYLVWFMPMQKKQKQLQEVIDALQKGDKVVTNGGFYGEVVKNEGNVVVLKLAENVKVRVAKRAIAGLADSADNGGK